MVGAIWKLTMFEMKGKNSSMFQEQLFWDTALHYGVVIRHQMHYYSLQLVGETRLSSEKQAIIICSSKETPVGTDVRSKAPDVQKNVHIWRVHR